MHCREFQNKLVSVCIQRIWQSGSMRKTFTGFTQVFYLLKRLVFAEILEFIPIFDIAQKRF